MENNAEALRKIALLRQQLDDLEKSIGRNTDAEKQSSSTEEKEASDSSTSEVNSSSSIEQPIKKEANIVSPATEPRPLESKPISNLSENQRALLFIFIFAALFCNLVLAARAANMSPMEFINNLSWLKKSYPNALYSYLSQGAVVWVIPVIASLVSYIRKKNYVHTYLVWQGWLVALVIVTFFVPTSM